MTKNYLVDQRALSMNSANLSTSSGNRAENFWLTVCTSIVESSNASNIWGFLPGKPCPVAEWSFERQKAVNLAEKKNYFLS